MSGEVNISIDSIKAYENVSQIPLNSCMGFETCTVKNEAAALDKIILGVNVQLADLTYYPEFSTFLSPVANAGKEIFRYFPPPNSGRFILILISQFRI